MTRQHKQRRTVIGPDGTPRTITERPANLGAEVTSIPESWRLVHLYCPNGHVVATLSPNADGEMLVMVRSLNLKPTPHYALTPAGQLDAVVLVYVGEDARVALVGDPRAEVPIRCVSCRRPAGDYTLAAADLISAGAKGETRMGLRRAESV